jgi:hypothetical protein
MKKRRMVTSVFQVNIGMNNLAYETQNIELAWMIFRLLIAETLSFTVFYVVFSKALGEERKPTSVVLSICVSVFCFQCVAELFSHLSEYITLASLVIFLFFLVYETHQK